MGNGNLSVEGHAFTRDEARAGRYHQTASRDARGRVIIDLDAAFDLMPRYGPLEGIDEMNSPAGSVALSLDEPLFARDSLTESEFGVWLETAGQDDTFA